MLFLWAKMAAKEKITRHVSEGPRQALMNSSTPIKEGAKIVNGWQGTTEIICM